ncbi:hypothetical protein DQ244_15450 [Blastococcus sp. TBT05-19]|uniref:hypothetical protein n=1 Tax=Blastococcus sp. TBT05-19 TaxID=2250581 RepID=UPI000DE9DE1F|nr:hypothetical protein [Blastococcus sp. TBT05-19]RBY89150.1 hypothetical protein DQ244_15450 [Blastococcus sp. TBT05-19]
MTVACIASVLAGLVLVSGCAGGTVCSAVGWSNELVVEFADGWPAVEGGVTIECEPACYTDPLVDAETATVDPADGGAAGALLDMSTPDSVVVRVLGPDGTRLTELEAELEWRRVGGTEECGGPHEATVVVPAP